MRVIHYRNPPLRAVVVLVAEPQCVADLVRCELADAFQRGLVEERRLLGAGRVWRQQPLEDHVVLPIAERAERDCRFEYLAGARIGEAAARAPAARRAMDPVDHVVADVHRVGALRQHVDLEAVAETGGFERLVPPARAFDERLPDVLRRAVVDPVLNRLHRLAHLRIRVFLHEAVAANPMHLHRIADRHAVVDERQAAVTGARIVPRAACSCCRAAPRTTRARATSPLRPWA